MNLDDRIARDADRWRADDHAPDFDTALDSATRSRRNLLAPILAAAAIVLIGLVIAALLALPRHAAPSGEKTGGLIYRRNVPSASLVLSAPTPNVPPPTTQADGTRVAFKAVPDVPAAAALVDPATPRRISLLVADNGGPECSVSDVSVTAVQVSDDSVYVQLAGIEMEERSANGDMLVHGCTAVHFYAVSVTLSQAIGDRSISVGNKHTRVPVLRAGELSEPSYLPPGYERRMDVRASDLSSSLSFLRTYQHGARGGLVLVSIQAATSPDAVAPSRTGPIDINGHRADFYVGNGHCLEWPLRFGVYESVCDQGKLADAQIIKIARSLK